MISKQKFLEASKPYFDERTAQLAWGDPDFQEYLKENDYEDSWAESAALTATEFFIPFDSVAEARKVIANDTDWLADLDEDEEDRQYSDFDEYITANYIIREFPDGAVVVKDLQAFNLLVG